MIGVKSREENKSTLFETTAGIGAGYATYTQAKKLARKPYGRYIIKQLDKLDARESFEFSKAAKEALKNNISLEIIAKITGLPIEKVQQLKEES